MPRPAYSIVFSAQVNGATGPVAVGDVVLPSASDPEVYVLATPANRGARRSEAVALTSFGGTGIGSVELQQSATLDASITGLGAGARALVRVSTAGRMERVASASMSDDIIGIADTDGRVTLYPRLPAVEIISLLIDPETGAIATNIGGTGQTSLGAPNQVLATNATADGTEWVNPGGGGSSPGGSDTQVQFNDSAAFGGDAGLTFNKTTNDLTVGGSVLHSGMRWSGVTVNNTTGAQNDVSLGGARKLRFTNAGGTTITGIDATGISDGDMVMLVNASAGAVSIQKNNAGSLAANRIMINPATCSLMPEASTILVYDGTSSRWRVLEMQQY